MPHGRVSPPLLSDPSPFLRIFRLDQIEMLDFTVYNIFLTSQVESHGSGWWWGGERGHVCCSFHARGLRGPRRVRAPASDHTAPACLLLFWRVCLDVAGQLLDHDLDALADGLRARLPHRHRHRLHVRG